MKKRRIIRILLVVLSMVCGSMSASAQIKDGDIVSIRKSGDINYFLYASESMWTPGTFNIYLKEIVPTLDYLWIINIDNGQYSFTNHP